MNRNMLLKLIQDSLAADLLSLDDLRTIREWADAAIERHGAAQRRDAQREKFISDTIRYGRMHRAKASTDELRAVAEYMYETQVLGRTPDDILHSEFGKNHPR